MYPWRISFQDKTHKSTDVVPFLASNYYIPYVHLCLLKSSKIHIMLFSHWLNLCRKKRKKSITCSFSIYSLFHINVAMGTKWLLVQCYHRIDKFSKISVKMWYNLPFLKTWFKNSSFLKLLYPPRVNTAYFCAAQ